MLKEIFRSTPYYNLHYFVNELDKRSGVYKAYHFSGNIRMEETFKTPIIPIEGRDDIYAYGIRQEWNDYKQRTFLFTQKGINDNGINIIFSYE